MEAFRKYFNENRLQDLAKTEPNWGVNIHTIGHHEHPPKTSYPDPQHPTSHAFQWSKGRILQEFQMVYIAKGRGIYESKETGELVVEAGTLMLHFPNIWHRYKPDYGTGWEEFWVGFDGHYPTYLMQQDCFSPQHPLINMGFNIEFMEAFVQLIDTFKHEGIAYRQIASCLVIQLLGLVYASALMKDKTQLKKERIVQTIQMYLHKNWSEKINFRELAAQHNVGYEWFRKSFKKVVGASPSQYLQQLKIEKASQMLRQTSLTVAEIAYEAGYESEFYFSRMFKQKTGMSPSDYRQGK